MAGYASSVLYEAYDGFGPEQSKIGLNVKIWEVRRVEGEMEWLRQRHSTVDC